MIVNTIKVVNLSDIRKIAGDAAEDWYQEVRKHAWEDEPHKMIPAKVLMRWDGHNPIPDAVLSCLWAFEIDDGWVNLSA